MERDYHGHYHHSNEQQQAAQQQEQQRQGNVPNNAPPISSLSEKGEEEQKFSEAVGQLFMSMEEVRQKVVAQRLPQQQEQQSATTGGGLITVHDVMEWQGCMEHWLSLMDWLWSQQTCGDNSTTTTTARAELLRHLHSKVLSVVSTVWNASLEGLVEPNEEDDDEEGEHHHLRRQQQQTEEEVGDRAQQQNVDGLRRDGQGAVARMTEIHLLLQCKERSNEDTSGKTKKESLLRDIVESYVAFQRQVLRKRVKPAIAKLVHQQRQGTFRNSTDTIANGDGSNQRMVVVHHHDDDVHDDDEEDRDTHHHSTSSSAAGAAPPYQAHHAPVLATILGQAAALIHPLQVWQHSLPPSPPPVPLNEQHHNVNDTNANDAVGVAVNQFMVHSIRTLCQDSIATLHEQAQSLTRTVSDWFWQDQAVKQWMERQQQQHAAAAAAAAISNRSDAASEFIESVQSGSTAAGASATLDRCTLGRLDGLVDEMALGCQVMARYQTLVQASSLSGGGDGSSSTSNCNTGGVDDPDSALVLERVLLPEWTWHYATLERWLAIQQWQAALQLASPQLLVLETSILVPSTVEDAQYISNRALERAVSTQSLQAAGTVAHAICQALWSTEMDVAATEATGGGGVHQAVVVDQRGCWQEPDETDKQEEQKNQQTTPPPSSGFASALLDALDQDLKETTTPLVANKKTPAPPPRSGSRVGGGRPPSAPSSGNFLSALMTVGSGGGSALREEQDALDTRFCVLNGIHACGVACHFLVTVLDDAFPQATAASAAAETEQQQNSNSNNKDMAMIQLAREELHRYAQQYESILLQQIKDTIATYCGGPIMEQSERLQPRGRSAKRKKGQDCLGQIQSFLEKEEYILDANNFSATEADERLHQALVLPLQEDSRLLQQWSSKCQAGVMERVENTLIGTTVDLILRVLWHANPPKRFNDWGSLLLSKQVRLLQDVLSNLLAAPATLSSQQSSALQRKHQVVVMARIQPWERLLQVVTVLQLEKPSDWLAYQPSTCLLSPAELQQTMLLRVDFSAEAVQSVIQSIQANNNSKSQHQKGKDECAYDGSLRNYMHNTVSKGHCT